MPSPITAITRLVDIPKKLYSLTKAIVAGSFISEERIKKRLEICFDCPLVEVLKTDGDDFNIRCGVCGCALKGESSLLNLAAYEETSSYGCKHPTGSQWKKQGV